MADVVVTSGGACARVVVRAGPTAAAAIGTVFGVRLSEAPCRANVHGDRAALWLGPDEWLLLAPERDGPAVLASIAEAVGEAPASVVDVSHRTIAIDVQGVRCGDALNAFCALDLHPDAFPVGMCTRTLFGKAEIILWRTAGDAFRLEVARSFGSYLQGCLAEAMREFMLPFAGESVIASSASDEAISRPARDCFGRSAASQ
ncbi:MAG: sarcosine oxidase subunit gamma [Acetobacteraceae bacterium]